MGFNDVLDLPCDMFLLMVKNHYINELNSTEEGQEYLKKCERLEMTEADRPGLERLKGR